MEATSPFTFKECKNSGARRGNLKGLHRSIETPCALFTTKKGHPNYLTPDKIKLNPCQPQGFVVSLPEVKILAFQNTAKAPKWNFAELCKILVFED